MSRFFQRSILVVAVAVAATLGLGLFLGQFEFFGVHAGQQDGAYRQMGVYRQVLSRIQSDYVTDPNMTNVTTGALHGLLESLDADSSYLTPTEYKIYKERPTSGVAQVGLTMSKRYGYATVVSVTPGSPADHEHIADGDVIESIGDQSTRELSLAVIRLLLEGKPGTNVALTVIRPRKSEPDKLTLTRTLVSDPSLAQQEYDNATVLYLKPGSLSAAHVDEIAAKIKAAKQQKVLLDLRDCTGGEAAQGLRLANFFVGTGTLATLTGQRFPAQTFAADPAQVLTTAPVAVLVNRGTYGAAELAAAAIKAAKRGDVVGERTFGEGSVQKTLEMQDGAALLLTVAKYQDASGKKIQDEAVVPTVQVGQASSSDDGDDTGATPAPAPKSDDPLNKALELLKAKTS